MNIIHRVMEIFFIIIAIFSFCKLIYHIGYEIIMRKRIRYFNKQIKGFNKLYEANKDLIVTNEIVFKTPLVELKGMIQDCPDEIVRYLMEQGNYIFDMEKSLQEEYGDLEKTLEYIIFLENFKNFKLAMFNNDKNIASKNDSV